MSETMGALAHNIMMGRYSHDGKETWSDIAKRTGENVLGALGFEPDHATTKYVVSLIEQRKFMPGGRYLASSGRDYHQVQNCLLLRAEDSVEGWGDLLNKCAVALMRGAGVGVDYSAIRARGSKVATTGHKAGGPVALMKAVNEVGRQMKEDNRLAAIWAGLSWSHPDIFDFITSKDNSPEIRALKEQDNSLPLPMEYTNISVILDREFFEAYHNDNHIRHRHAKRVYWFTVKRMLKHGEPGFSVNFDNPRESLRNACTEITSEDDSDICNLGSINIARIGNVVEFRDVVRAATLFLLAGTVYSDLPYDKVREVREKNRRLGLGLMGVHEWLLQRGHQYGPNNQLEEWLEVYRQSTVYAHQFADQFGLSRPVKTRAMAPTGTIGMLAETTTSLQPIMCVAYLRRWKDGDIWQEKYVVDPTAQRRIEAGMDPDDIEDAYKISFATQVDMQAWFQKYVDHGISFTINLPHPVTEENEIKSYGEQLLIKLPQLRGVTVYPDGARSGQPITPVSYDEAVNPEVYQEDQCLSGSCNI